MVSQVFYCNADKFPAIAQDYCDIKSRVDKKSQSQEDTEQNDTTVFKSLMEVIPQGRRLATTDDNAKKGNYASVAGALGLTLINAKEDMRDIQGAINQIKGVAPKYDNKEYQHSFSFLRGTIIEKWVNKNYKERKKWAIWVRKNDITMADTIFGEKLLAATKGKEAEIIKSSIKNINGNDASATKYDGNIIGQLTGRALKRTTKLGLIVSGLIETPKIIGAMAKDGSLSDKETSAAKQAAKSALNVASVTAGISYCGAAGFKFKGATGSLIGMGLGAILGNKLSDKIQQAI